MHPLRPQNLAGQPSPTAAEGTRAGTSPVGSHGFLEGLPGSPAAHRCAKADSGDQPLGARPAHLGRHVWVSVLCMLLTGWASIQPAGAANPGAGSAQAAKQAPARPPPPAKKAAAAAAPTAADLAKCNTQLAASQKAQKAAEAAKLAADGQKKKLAADLATSKKDSAALQVGCLAAMELQALAAAGSQPPASGMHCCRSAIPLLHPAPDLLNFLAWLQDSLKKCGTNSTALAASLAQSQASLKAKTSQALQQQTQIQVGQRSN